MAPPGLELSVSFKVTNDTVAQERVRLDHGYVTMYGVGRDSVLLGAIHVNPGEKPVVLDSLQLEQRGVICPSNGEPEEVFLEGFVDLLRDSTVSGPTEVPFTIRVKGPLESYYGSLFSIKYSVRAIAVVKRKTMYCDREFYLHGAVQRDEITAPIDVLSKLRGGSVSVRLSRSLYSTLDWVSGGLRILRGQEQSEPAPLHVSAILVCCECYGDKRESFEAGKWDLAIRPEPGEEIPVLIPLRPMQLSSTVSLPGKLSVGYKLVFAFTFSEDGSERVYVPVELQIMREIDG